MSTDTAFETLIDVGEHLRDMAPSAEDVEARRLLASITAEPRSAPPAPRRRRWLAAAVAVASVAAVAAAWALLSAEPTSTEGILCHQSTELRGDVYVLPPADVSDFTASACAAVWERGDLTLPGLEAGEVPPLQGCVDALGILSVYPTDDESICAKFDQRVADPVTESELGAVLELQRRLVDEYSLGMTCMPFADAEQLARDTIAELDLDWVVVVGTATEDRPCATWSFVDEDKKVLLVPSPPSG